MKAIRTFATAFAASLVLTGAVWAQASEGTADDAKKLVASAAEYVKKVGPDAAAKAFETDKNKWVVKDLSVWLMDSKGVMKYHENPIDSLAGQPERATRGWRPRSTANA